mmetsp:Transcript_26687/g.48454  ORF Transcript_26687/g.48454 Transcript_26687/m.48454 type:complete len:171 (-) Transcript_26687:1083-1595(-)
MLTLPSNAARLSKLAFDSSKCAPGYLVSADALTATLTSGGGAYQTVQSVEPITEGRWYFDAVFQGLVGGIGFSHPVNPAQVNIYNDNSFLLSGYGDLYSFGGYIKLSKNISRSTGTHYRALLDMDAGELTYWVDGEQLETVKHECLKSGEWFVTATFGSGAAGSSFRITE